jgi:hypothetical protein
MGTGNLSVQNCGSKRERACHLFGGSESQSFGEGLGFSEVSLTGGVVDISCLEVIRELSNYIDKEVTPILRDQILAHLPGCSHCTAVYNGLRNIITLTADGRAFDLPAEFSQRLRAKLAKESEAVCPSDRTLHSE